MFRMWPPYNIPPVDPRDQAFHFKILLIHLGILVLVFTSH